MRTKILFLDWHDTVSADKFFLSLHTSKAEDDRKLGEAIESLLFKESGDYLMDWMRGDLTSEQVIMYVSKKLNIDYNWLWSVFVADCKKMSIQTHVKRRLTHLREYYYLVLVTGNMDCFNRFTVPEQKLELLFDEIINSYDLGYFKNEYGGQVFKDVIHNKNVPSIYGCYLLEDNPNVCKVFKEIGGVSYNVNIANQKLVYQTLDRLKKRGPNMILPFPVT
ncbi:MAG: hypothetical protein H6603_01050 [Flavobacteriales bacterium]|nr:hypothetical protein [Flavobacteriales bacterium]MCB9203536.1 hypothetical protein [Flavobacteriales bacterium]